jgi:hypothetical protein
MDKGVIKMDGPTEAVLTAYDDDIAAKKSEKDKKDSES